MGLTSETSQTHPEQNSRSGNPSLCNKFKGKKSMESEASGRGTGYQVIGLHWHFCRCWQKNEEGN